MKAITFKRTRLAPTPSGFLHGGNVYSFALTAALVKKYQAKLLLRIDDLDQERIKEEYVQDIFDTLHFMNITWDEGPQNMEEYRANYSQVQRRNLYGKALDELRKNGMVYACSCSRTEILQERPDGTYSGRCRHKHLPLDQKNLSWRLDTSQAISLQIKTIEGENVETCLPEQMNDFIVRRKDGLAAYQLSSLIDDCYFDVDLIVRGEDLWNSTLAQLYLARILGKREFEKATFHHHSLIRGTGGDKLSKSAGDTSVKHLRKEGMDLMEIYKMIGLRI